MPTKIKYPTPYRKTPTWKWIDHFVVYFCLAIFFILVGYTWAYQAYSPHITELKYEISCLETKLFNNQIKGKIQNDIIK